MRLAISILPNGDKELINGEFLADVPGEALVPYEPGSPEYGDFHECVRNLVGVDGPPYPVVSRDIHAQAAYLRMRLAGESHSMAEMLATRSFPGLRTDTTFNAGRCNGNQFESCPARGDWLKAQAEAAGVSTTGKYYSSGLARFPGDPKAWISDRGDVLRIARENDMTVSGDVNYKAPERDPGGDVDVAPEILAREVDSYLECNPDARREDAAERVRDVLTGKVDLNPEPLVQG